MKAAVALAALGYFVDVFDLLLFSIVRVQSLKDLGLSGDELLDEGLFLLNMQMAGMLVGGVFWGVLGDKLGRLRVLFGSIVTYSLATFLNAFVSSVPEYAVLRFIGGVGLAGELGAGITLVSELMDKERRGLGTTIVASLGVSGAIVAALVGELFDWRTCYMIGGGLGFLLLVLRVAVFESEMFEEAKQRATRRGDFLMLFTSRERALRYVMCLLSGLPIWFIVGILITFSPEFSVAFGMAEAPVAGRAIMFAYVGFVLGDVASGLLSQALRSRRKALFLFLGLTGLMMVWYLESGPISVTYLYALCVGLGFAGGYWAVFITTAAEQFGTNLRATVTTTAPNFVRGSLVILAFGFEALKPSVGIVSAAYIVGLGSVLIASVAVYHLKETFARDLGFLEE